MYNTILKSYNMDTYKISENWATFKQFIIDNLNNVNKDDIGFMYRKNVIIIRSYDEKILDIIRKHYALTPFEQPSNFLDKDEGWAYFGNAKLFDIKL